MLTLLEIIKRTADFFGQKGVENPRLQAELLIGHVLGLKRMQLYLQFERLLTEPELEKIRPLVRRRAQREPLQYILGEVEFWGLKLKVDRRALIPRPETERLMEIVVERLTARLPAKILDLGTGTGALALASAKQWPEARVTAIDQSGEALALARENAVALSLVDRVDFVQSNWFSTVGAEVHFDLIVANPPYLSAEETGQAQPEVKNYEPASALTGGGPEGRADLDTILVQAKDHLSTGGLVALETGIAQHSALVSRAAELGYGSLASLKDLAGRDRYLLAVKPE
ncbi:MAG TPA: peptide chain release factor N(5)-glutamine methyltransferase [Opitutaceae bacterium]|nr:peptide chain release factor N(5)-glutamine methyltransferase [Opitutaceae bacterium]